MSSSSSSGWFFSPLLELLSSTDSAWSRYLKYVIQEITQWQWHSMLQLPYPTDNIWESVCVLLVIIMTRYFNVQSLVYNFHGCVTIIQILFSKPQANLILLFLFQKTPHYNWSTACTGLMSWLKGAIINLMKSWAVKRWKIPGVNCCYLILKPTHLLRIWLKK